MYLFIIASALVLLDMIMTYLSYRSTEKQIAGIMELIYEIEARYDLMYETNEAANANGAKKMREYKADIVTQQEDILQKLRKLTEEVDNWKQKKD